MWETFAVLHPAVARNRIEWVAHDGAHVVLVHAMKHHLRATRCEQIEQGLDLGFHRGRSALFAIDDGNIFSVQRRVGRVARHHGIAEIRTLVCTGAGENFAGDLCPLGGINQALLDILAATFARPVGQHHAQCRAAGGVGILIDRHIEPLGTGTLDQREHLARTPPVALTTDFQMRNLHRNPGGTPDIERLVDRLHDLVGFIADMRSVNAAVRRRRAREADHFFGAAVHPRQIKQPGG